MPTLRLPVVSQPRRALPRCVSIALALTLGATSLLTVAPARAEDFVVSDLGSNPTIDTAIQQLLEAGDLPLLQKIVSPHNQPMRGHLLVDANTALARAWIFLGDNKTALRFALAAHADAPEKPVPRWLAAELSYTLNNETAGDELAALPVDNGTPPNPVVPYLKARKILAKLARYDFSYDNPQRTFDRVVAQNYVRQCCSPEARFHSDFDPRFLSLGIDVGMIDLDYPFAAGYAAQLCTARPRNAPLARLTLALALDQPALRTKLFVLIRTSQTLPTGEINHWEEQMKRFDDASQRVDALFSLIEISKGNPAFANLTIHFIGRLATLLPKDDPRSATMVKKYAEAALTNRSAPHARAAFGLFSPAPTDASDEPDLRIAVARLGGLHELAAALVMNQLEARKDDFAWLEAHRAFVAGSQDTGMNHYAEYLAAMERLQPNAPVVLIGLARVNYRANSRTALGYYERAFTAVPQPPQVTLQDWLAYRQASEEAVAKDRGKDALARFDANVERIHKNDTADLNAAHFYAELLDRRAIASKNPEDQAAATIAFKKALALDPDAGDLLADVREKLALRPAL